MANISPDTNPVSPPMPYNNNTYNDGANTAYVNVDIINGSPSTANTNAPTITIDSFSEVDPYSGGTSAIGYNSVIYKYGTTTQVTGSYQGYNPGSHATIITPSSLISGGATNADIGIELYILFYSDLNYTDSGGSPHTLPPSFNPGVGSSANPGGLQTGYRIKVQPCGIPTSLSGTPYVSTQVPLTWTAPSDDGGSAITNYIIQYNSTSSSGPWSNQVTTPSFNTNYTITGLTNGTTYYFQVAAVNGYCNSGGPPSGPFSTTAIATPATTPDPPTDIQTANGVSSISVTWNAPSNTGGAAVTSYTLQYRELTTPTPNWIIQPNIPISPTPHHIIGSLNINTTYEIQVASVNPAGQGSYSASVLGTTDNTPDNPTNLLGTPGNQQVSLTWHVPSSDGGTPITEYLVEFKLESTNVPPGSWTQILTGSTAVTYIVGPSAPYTLTNGSLYDFRVSAVNALGVGSHSSIIKVTPSTIPMAPVITSSTTCDNQQSLVTWAPPLDDGGSPITSYNLQYSSTSSTGPWLPALPLLPYSVSGLTTSYLFTDLINGTQYYFQVQAVNINGPSLLYSAPNINSTATPSITPQPPIPITTTAVTSTSIALSWTTPTGLANTGGNPVTGYIIYWTEISSTGSIIPPTYSYNTTTGGTPLATSYTITGLTHATLYEIQISSVNCSGVGPISTPLYITTSSIPPSAPTNVTITGCNSTYTNSITLTWTTPANNGGSPITNYIVYYRTTSPPNSTWYTYNTNSASTTAIVSVPSSGVSYDFKVAAQNAAGAGIFSPIVSSLSYNPTTAPTNLAANTNSSGFVVLTWNASTQELPQTISYYVIEYKICEFGGWITYPTTIVSPITSAIINDPNIANNVPYLFRVYAVNSCGSQSDRSNIDGGTSYNNNAPTRLWSRFNLNCSGNITSIDNLNRDMLRKGQVLQYPVVGTLQFSRATLWSMAAKNQLTRKKAWASQSEEYTYPNTTNINNQPDVGLRQTPTSLVCWRQPPAVICNSSTASDVPGNPTTLCISKNAPFNNFRRPITYLAGGTKFPVIFSK
jgi:hypothetical protein